MFKSIACVNLKGGVGKTALAVNLAAYSGKKGLRTLLIDLDPQTNATFSCIDVDRWEELSAKNGTVANLMDLRSYSSPEGKKRTAKSIIIKSVFQNVDLIPSHLDLFTIDLDLAAATARESKLKRALEPLKNDYDIVVCDCPPNLTIPTQNALSLCSHYVVPISPDYLSGIGVSLLIKRVKMFCEDMDHTLDLAGIVISRVGRPAIHREQTVAAIKQTFKKDVIKIQIHERVAVAESAAVKKPIYDMSDGAATNEFTKVSKEILERMGL